MILIRDGRVLRAGGVETASVMIEGDTVTGVGPDLEPSAGATVLEAGGAWVGPGFVDLHAHLREPGQTWKEDFDSGAAAARRGGYTAVVAMPNTEPPPDRASRLEEIRRAASRAQGVDIVLAGTLTEARAGEEMSDLDGLYEAGVRIFSDDGDSPQDAGLLRMVMKYLTDLPGAVVADHPEERSLSRDGHIHAGMVAARLGVSATPSIAEEVAVARDLELARDTGMRLHLQHVSTAGSVRLIRRAKEDGIPVTAEVTPHHLALDETAVEDLDPDTKMYPPLRRERDRMALVEALREGTIDCVATDHAPHAPSEKAVPFEQAPRGVIGLETAAPLVRSALGEPSSFFTRMSLAPARIAGLARHGRPVEPGAPANLVVFHPDRRWIVSSFAGKSRNSPFVGREMTGMVIATIHQGRLVHEVRL